MKIYTKKGDKGSTQLLGGSIVKKNHIKLECYGTIDELNAFIGNIYDEEINSSAKKMLLKIQNQLFNLGSCIAFDKTKRGIALKDITDQSINTLEKEIDKMNICTSSINKFYFTLGIIYSIKVPYCAYSLQKS